MLKKVALSVFAMAVMVMQSICLADYAETKTTNDFLNGDHNYPLTSSYGGCFEYTDLASCQIIEDEEELQFSVGYIAKSVHNRDGSYKVRYFRWQKSEDARPQFRNSIDDGWTVIPEPDRPISRTSDAKTYHIIEYRMFKTAYEYLFISDNGNG